MHNVYEQEQIRRLRFTFIVIAVVFALFIFHFISLPRGGKNIFTRLFVVVLIIAVSVLSLTAYALSKRNPNDFIKIAYTRFSVYALSAICFFWSAAFFASALFPGIPFMNGDVTLAFSAAVGLLGWRLLVHSDSKEKENFIRLRHKVVFALLVLVVSAEVLLRLFGDSFFPDSRQNRIKAYFRSMYFVDDSERKRHVEIADKWISNKVPGWIEDPRIGFVVNPSAYPGYANVYNTDHHNKPVPEGVCRIVCIGGSAVFMGFPRFLDGALKEKFTGVDFDVIDAAAPGYTSLHSFLNYRFRVSKSRPDIVIIYHGINELKYLFSKNLKDDYSHYGIRGHLPDEDKSVSELISRLAVFKFVNIMGMRIFAKPLFTPKWNQELTEYSRQVALNHMRDLLSAVRESGAKTVLCTYPTAQGGDYPPEIAEKIDKHLNAYAPGVKLDAAVLALSQLNEDVRNLAKERAIPLLDLEKTFPRKADFFVDCCHFSDKGAAYMASVVAGFLKEKMLSEMQK